MAPISELITGRLAGAVLNSGGSRLKTAVLGTEEERAIRSAFGAAFSAALEDMAHDQGLRDLDEIEPQLEDFFRVPEVSGALVEVALSRRAPDLDKLQGQLWAAGFDPSTFPVDVREFIPLLSMHLAAELGRHAARAESAIFNQYALAELASLHAHVEQLLRDRAGDHGDGATGQAPPLPGLVLGREQAVRDIKARLGLSSGHAEATRTQVITAVRGWPGVGKTTLVSAIAHDPEVVAAFPDGVLWGTLTHSDRVPVELASWARALHVNPGGPGTSIGELSGRLRAALREKRCLLLLDDVWEAADAEPFRVGGRGCALLVTTRIPDVASALVPTSDDVYRLDVLDDDSALELLERLAPTVVATHRDATRELVQALEGLPLALQVAGHQLHSEESLGLGVEELLKELREGAKLLEAKAPADRTDLVEQTTPTVAALLSQSTDRLAPEDRGRFAMLGAFAPKPATFSVEALVSVWELDDPVPTIRTLVQRGLLEPIGQRRFQMHALLVLHASSLLDD